MKLIFILLLFLSVSYGQVNDKNFKEKINGGIVVTILTSEWQDGEFDESLIKGVKGYQGCKILYIKRAKTLKG